MVPDARVDPEMYAPEGEPGLRDYCVFLSLAAV
jgi:hypothetical protein